jgi:hypothetical protein
MSTEKSPYNQLSLNTITKFDVLYSEYRGDGITTFRTNTKKWGALSNANSILIPAEFDSIYYNFDFKYFECVLYKEGNYQNPKTFIFYNQNGVEQGKIENIKFCTKHRFGYYRFQIENSEKWGIINTSCEIIVKNKYQNIGALSKNLFEVQKNDKWGIVDIEEKLLLDFKASNIHGTFINNYVIAKLDDAYYKINQNGELIENLGITHILRPASNSYWSKNNSERRKVLLNGIERAETNEFYPFDEITEYKGKWGIIDLSGELLIEPKYDYIDFFELTDCYKAVIGVIYFDNNQNGQILLKGGKSGVIDSEGKIVIPLRYDWVEEIAPNLWAVNNGGVVFYNEEYQEEYWTVQGGKWGVINSKNEEIVPIKYDVIMKNWFRVKDLIIVQNGTKHFDGLVDYDAYSFEGKKLDGKRIDYKNHIYYKG